MPHTVLCGDDVVKPKNFMDRTGETVDNFQGMKMTIINYPSSSHIDVRFEDGTIVKDRLYHWFQKGKIANPNIPSVVGVGYLGQGEYKTTGKDRRCYYTWYNMLSRCYNENVVRKHPTYAGCSVCQEWHNFQHFAEWYYSHLWGDEGSKVIDKDIISKNNKVYSPNTCIMIDQRINSLFTNRKNLRGNQPLGVYKRGNSYKASCSFGDGNPINIGTFSSAKEAFLAYKEAKEKYIKEVADEYAHKYNDFPKVVYDAMYSYEISCLD